MFARSSRVSGHEVVKTDEGDGSIMFGRCCQQDREAAALMRKVVTQRVKSGASAFGFEGVACTSLATLAIDMRSSGCQLELAGL